MTGRRTQVGVGWAIVLAASVASAAPVRIEVRAERSKLAEGLAEALRLYATDGRAEVVVAPSGSESADSVVLAAAPGRTPAWVELRRRGAVLRRFPFPANEQAAMALALKVRAVLEAPSKGSNEIPGAVGEVSKGSNEVPEAVGEVSKGPIEVPEAVGEVSKGSIEVPEAVAEVPKASIEVPEAVAEAPKESNEVPEAVEEVSKAPIEVPKASEEVSKAPIAAPEASGGPSAPVSRFEIALQAGGAWAAGPDEAVGTLGLRARWWAESVGIGLGATLATPIEVRGTAGRATLALGAAGPEVLWKWRFSAFDVAAGPSLRLHVADVSAHAKDERRGDVTRPSAGFGGLVAVRVPFSAHFAASGEVSAEFLSPRWTFTLDGAPGPRSPGIVAGAAVGVSWEGP